MGTKLSSLLEPEEISYEDLKGKRLVIDAFNNLYQYLSSIRQYDGTPLKDSKGNITSHLSGLFFRTSRLMSLGLRLAFCFDGKPPELKKKEQERRHAIKEESIKKYKEAEAAQDIEEMRKYASRTSKLTSEMIDESKKLISALGLPIVQAPSEAEAQAAHMAKKGDFYAVISQDTDSLLFGAPKILKNLTLSQKKKRAGSSAYSRVLPELIRLDSTLNSLGIDNDQLIALAMLVGTDFNIGGIKGIGPKKGIKLVIEHGKDFDSLFREAGWKEHFDFPWKEVFDIIKHMPTTDKYELEWENVKKDEVISLLVSKHEFSKDRVLSSLDRIAKENKQKGLDAWF